MKTRTSIMHYPKKKRNYKTYFAFCFYLISVFISSPIRRDRFPYVIYSINICPVVMIDPVLRTSLFCHCGFVVSISFEKNHFC